MFPQRLQRATEIPISKGRTAALALADKFEADIVRQDRAGGKVFGPEHRLQAEYKASGNVVRQALRILEARRIGSMRRGVGGGLELRVPDLAETGQLIALYLSAIDADCSDTASAIALLQRHMEGRNRSLLAWTQELLDGVSLALDMPLQSVGVSAGNRAMVIARRIMTAARGSVGVVDGARLGSLGELVESHSSGRPVILQALRILEDLEMVRVQLGRGGGFVLRRPTPGAIVRAVFPHFELNRLPAAWLSELIWTINTINAQVVAKRFTGRSFKQLEDAARAVRPSQFERGDISLQLSIWRILADMHGNETLHVLIRILFYYQVQSGLGAILPMTAGAAQKIHGLTIDLVEAIISGATQDIPVLMRAYERASG